MSKVYNAKDIDYIAKVPSVVRCLVNVYAKYHNYPIEMIKTKSHGSNYVRPTGVISLDTLYEMKKRKRKTDTIEVAISYMEDNPISRKGYTTKIKENKYRMIKFYNMSRYRYLRFIGNGDLEYAYNTLFKNRFDCMCKDLIEFRDTFESQWQYSKAMSSISGLKVSVVNERIRYIDRPYYGYRWQSFVKLRELHKLIRKYNEREAL